NSLAEVRLTDRIRHVVRHLLCLAAVLLVSLVFVKLTPVNATTAALTFLLMVLLVAAVWGLAESITISLTAFLAFNFFFLPPIGTFSIEHPADLIALVTFLIGAVIASQLAARAQRRTSEALRRRRETEQLFALGRSILLAGSPEDILPRMARDVT